MIKKFKIFESRFKNEPIKAKPYIYHVSNPIFRKSILEKGLIPQKGEQRMTGSGEHYKEAIFATNSDIKKDWFDSTYDDDVYRIDTTKINNIWYKDQNIGTHHDHPHIVTFQPIPPEAIELIYKGSGNDKLKRGWKKNRFTDPVIENVTPKSSVEDEIDRLMDKGIKNLTPEEREFLKDPYKPKEEKPKKDILKYYPTAEIFFRKVLGADVKNYDLDDNIDLYDILGEDEVYKAVNDIYYMYDIQIDPEDNNDFKLINIFKKISQKNK